MPLKTFRHVATVLHSIFLENTNPPRSYRRLTEWAIGIRRTNVEKKFDIAIMSIIQSLGYWFRDRMRRIGRWLAVCLVDWVAIASKREVWQRQT